MIDAGNNFQEDGPCASGVVAAAGLGIALLVSHPFAGVAGFACLGIGLACIAPQVFSAAANRDPARAGRAIAKVAGLGFAGFVVGPLIIGLVAEVLDLRRALVIPVVLALFVALSARALRPRPTAIPGQAIHVEPVVEGASFRQ